MRKFFALLLILCLMPFAGLAELMDYNFGDFTLSMPSDIIGQIVEKKNNEVFFSLFPDYNEDEAFHHHINGVWGEAYEDVTKLDLDALGQQVLVGISSGLTQQGIAITNGRVLSASQLQIDGRNAASIAFSYDADYTGAGVDLKLTLYLVQFYVSEPDLGTYTFTYTTDDTSKAEAAMEILSSLKWNAATPDSGHAQAPDAQTAQP